MRVCITNGKCALLTEGCYSSSWGEAVSASSFQTDHRLPWRTGQYLLGLLFSFSSMEWRSVTPSCSCGLRVGPVLSRAVFLSLFRGDHLFPCLLTNNGQTFICVLASLHLLEADYILFCSYYSAFIRQWECHNEKANHILTIQGLTLMGPLEFSSLLLPFSFFTFQNFNLIWGRIEAADTEKEPVGDGGDWDELRRVTYINYHV